MTTGTFLTKRYYDVVDANGAWAIAYDARLDWLGLAYRELTGQGVPAGCRSLEFRCAAESFVFAGAAAHWHGGDVADGPSFENDALRWRLVKLRSRAEVGAGAVRFGGLGYGEEIALKRPPWRLGIREFRWGRYLSPVTFVTWIVADGDVPIRFGVHDSTPVAAVDADARGAQVGGAAVVFTGLKHRIASGDALAGRPGLLRALRRMFGGGAFRIEQDKAVYAARVRTPTREESGFVIAEHGSISAIGKV